ncbi:amino acid adenylation domain-containing protein [Streptomyces harbinensis]|uniref:amino acid adenylation domain-containing protein n=1 Tax=Streptomyces harbinensis TaxID=1176198 RepID=UPI0036CC3B31
MDNGIRRPENAPAHSSRTLRPRPADRGPLSFGQQRLWFLDRWLSGRPVYNVPVTLRFTGPLPADAEDRLLTALHTVAAGQDVLFTVIEEDAAGEPRQRVLADRRVPGRRVDLSPGGDGEAGGDGGDAGRLRARAEALVKAEAVAPFDLAAGPMLRFVLLRLADDELWLHLTFHHIACDGWSVEVFQRQLLAAWERDGAAEDAGVQGAPRVQFADYALWQREAVAGPRAEAALGAWEKALDGAPEVLDLGTGKPRPAELSHRGRTESFPLTGAGVPPAALETFAAEHNATLYMVLLASFQTLVARHSGGGDIVLGSPVAGRGLPQLNELIGFFADSLVIRTDLSDDPSFRSLVGRARSGVLDALGRSRVPFDVAVQRLRPERSLSHTPVVQVVFALHEEEPEVPLPGGVEVRRTMVPTDTAKFDLTWSVYRGAGGLRLEVEYATDLFDAADVAVLVGHWQTLLEHAVREPDLPVSRLELMPAGERELVGSWSGDGRTCTSGLLHERVAERAAETPDAIAVVCGDDRLTYRQLDGRANALAHELRDRGVGPEVPVGLLIDRSAEAVIGALGVLKAGGVYVPLDTTFPGERLRHMLTETGARLVLTHGATPPAGPWGTLDLAAVAGTRPAVADPPRLGPVSPDQACYVIFTSGSTGRPKGTTVTHRNVTRLFTAAETVITPRREDVWSQFHSLAFDFSVWEIWGPLTTGARLVIVPRDTARDAHAFHALLAREEVSVLSQTPTAFRQLETVDAERGTALSLRAVVFGGEPLHQPSVRAWADRHGYHSPALINMYGITETTVHVTHHRIGPGDLGHSTAPIGPALPDLTVRVLDRHGLPVPIGVTGELYVGGPGVARGYTGQPALTADRFVPDPYGPPGARLYRTGDLGRWTPQGALHHRGRADQQIKVRGHRLEPAEIEAALHQHPDIAQAHITHTHPDTLTAYLTTTHQQPPNTTALRAWLTTQLPSYAIPHHFIHLPRLPLTPQGKIDTRSLPAPDQERPQLGPAYAAPHGPVEEVLAGVWGEVLGVRRVGRDDSFFDLGGDSIRAIQVLGRARSGGVSFALQDLFRHPTPAGLAAVSSVTGESGDADGEPPAGPEPFSLLSPEDRDKLPDGLVDAYPMAELQVGMVYEMEFDPDRRPYHNVDSLRIIGPFDEAVFRDAVARVVARHPILRTSFDLSGYSEPLQLVHPHAEMPFTVVDVRELDEAAQEEVIGGYVRAERAHRFDHTQPLLLRFGLHRLADEAFQWTITEHHAIFDGWSLHSTLSEITSLYQELLAGGDPRLEPPTSTYRDFIAAEKAAMASRESEEFWRERVGDRPDCRLPRRPAGAPSVPAGETMPDEWRVHNEAEGYGSVETLLPQEVCDGLQEVARRCGVPFKAVALAAHLRAISVLTGGTDLLVGLTANGRLEETDGTEARGLYLNTVPFRLRLPSGSWADLVRAVFATERDLLPHRRYPLGALQRGLGGGPLFEVNFVYNHFHVLGKAFGADRIRIEDGKIDSFSTERAEPTNFPLNVGVIRNPYSSRLLLGLDYHPDVLTQEQVLLLRDVYVRVMRAMVADPEAPHGQARLVGDAELAVIGSWQGPRVEVPEVLVHEMVAARAADTPDAVAVVAGKQQLTYAELDVRANRLAHRLRDLGVGPDVCVALCVERSTEMIIGLLGILKAGGTYVPLDPDFPTGRLEYMLQQVAAPLVLTTERVAGRVPDGPWRTVELERPQPAGPERDAAPVSGVGPDHGCYVIFTSGSTGKPKGVLTRHRNVTELLHGAPFLTLNGADTLVQLAPLPFDNSTFEVWAPLVGGARLVMAPPISYGPSDIARWVQEYDVTVLHATASLFTLLVDHEPATFDRLRRFLTGSETVSPQHARRILDRCPELELVNCWGPTETTTFSVCGTYTRDTLPDGPLPLGSPLANTEVHVLDEAGLPTPIGTPGELYVSGPCLARGYLNNPTLTAERFLPHPQHPGRRLYRTGDRGRWAPNGTVEFLGRVDHMIKIRGYRIELGEVETALRAHPQVRECVVVARQDGTGPAALVGYLVPHDPAPTRGELRAWLGERLPGYMVPRQFVFLDALPLTPRAKVDRRALPAPDGERPDLVQEFDPPQGPVETQLAAIWQHVLGIDRIGRHDNFFDLGGDSIRSIQILGQARTAGLSFALQEVARRPTLAELAGAVTREVHDTGAATAPRHAPFDLLPPEDRATLPDGLVDAYPMAQLQIGMVYEQERDRERAPYHNVHSVRLSGPFDEAAFRAALAAVVARHPVLRTSFDLSGCSVPVQRVHAEAVTPLTVTDLRGLDDAGRPAALAAHVDRERSRPLDISEAPLWRMAVHLLPGDAFQWTITEHHAILDGWSLASTLTEITTAYRALLTGRHRPAEPPRSTFRDFVAAERAALTSPESRAYWHHLLADRPDTRLPTAGLPGTAGGEAETHQHDEAQGYGALSTVLPAELLGRLDRLARRSGIPVKSVVLAAHLRVLSLLTGSMDVISGLTAHGRLEEADATEARGLFLNTLPFRMRLPGGSWADLARAVFVREQDAQPHRRYPMATLQRELGGDPLFEVSFVYNHFHQLAAATAGPEMSLTAAEADVRGGMARTHFPLVVAVSRGLETEGLRLEFEYDARRLTRERVRALRDAYARVLTTMVADPEAPHREARLVGDAEPAVIGSWQGPRVEVPEVLVHEMVAARAVDTPDAVAVVAGTQQLTYAELDVRANRLAHRLRDLGVRPDVCVALCAERSTEMIIGLLGILKAGGTYVPLDPDFPTARLDGMLRECGAGVVLATDTMRERVPAGPWAVLPLTAPADEPGDPLRDAAPVSGVGPDHGCYIVFTSGSTGKPKGVLTRHRNVTELLHGGPSMVLRPADVLLQIAPASFDVATFEVWAPLVGGARLVMAPPISYGPSDIARWVQEYDVTVLHATASLFTLLVDHEPATFDRLRRFLTGSETVSPQHARRILDRCPDFELVNCWGPTETTTFSVCGTYTRDTLPDGPLPLGSPLANTEVHVLDEAGLPTPIGTPGELYVSGPCLARGYLNNPTLTAERFLPHPQHPGRRLYRTGDRGRWAPNGTVEFLGRVDHMIKIRGYRIELGEIEAVLREQPDVRACVVTARSAEGTPGVVTDLVAYVVPRPGAAVPADLLRAWLSARLPGYMVPQRFVTLDALPLTPNAKVDRAALPEPTAERPTLGQAFDPPQGPVETQLAAIWQHVLGIDRVGRHDNFFDLGGDSIRSIQVLGHAREGGVAFALQDLLDHPTPAALAAAAAREPQENTAALPAEPFSLLSAEDRALLPGGLADAYPMAELQTGMVYEQERSPGRNPYHNVETLRLTGPFDEAAFRAALAAVVARHPVLRTSFDLNRFSEPVQLVHAQAETPLTVTDLRGLDTAGQEAALAELVREQQRETLPLDRAPLWRMAVHLLTDDAFQWTITEHHAILDGWSLASTVSEIGAGYRARQAGQELRPEPPRSTFRDFVAAERAALASPDSEVFWRDLLADRPDPELPRVAVAGLPAAAVRQVPGERHRSDAAAGRGALETPVAPELTAALEAFARGAGVPFKSVLLAAHLRVLGVAGGTTDVVTGLSSNGRLEEADATEARGLFLNTLPFRMRLPGGSWADLARAVHAAERAMLPHRRYPMAAMRRKLGGGPLFAAGFVHHHFHQLDGAPPAAGAAEQPVAGAGWTTFPLLVSLSREPGAAGLRLVLEYDATELSAEQTGWLRDAHLRALEAMAADPEAPYGAVSLLPAGERELVGSWSGDGRTCASGLLHERVAERAAETPDAIAVVSGDDHLTYRELDERANALAHELRDRGVGPEVPVGLLIDRSAEAVIGALGVLKAGGIYVPLDTTFPGERLRHMLTETGAPLVLTHGATPPAGPWTTLDLADCRERADTGPEVTTDPENACYVIFTSGSTGKPKGTTVTHRNVTRLFTAAETVITPRRDDVWSQFHSLAFDFSVWEIWGPLTTGARLVVVPHATARDTHAFHALVRAAGVTVLSLTPTAFRAFEEVDAAGGGNPSPLRAVVFGGEPLHQPSVRAWADRHGYHSPALINMYGITETTVHVTHHRLTAEDLAGATPPVGRGLPDLRLYVLGPDGLPAPIGVTGELYVGGAGVARGYTGQPALTADRFVPDPYGPAGARLYRTGDLGYWTPDGTLHHRGRADQQIKVRGHRLEPAEIEAALHQHPDIAQAYVTHTHPDSLTAYLTTTSEQPPNTSALRAWLAAVLPEFAIPHHYVHLPRLPLTSQGKIDTRSLPAPDRERPELAVGYEEPLPGREAALAAVWRGVLGTERIGRHDSFFDLGGDSIRAIRLLGRAREAGLRFGMPDLLERPTVARLAEVTEVAAPTDVQEQADDGAFTLLSPEDRDRLPDGLADAYPMAELQVGMVYEMESDPDRLPYLNVETLRLPGEFDEAAFRQAVGLAVARHPALRTSFDLTGYSEPVQLVHHAVEVPLTVTDLRELDEAGRRAALVAYIEGERQRRFVLESAPLWRMAVHVLGDAAFQWTITEHHAVLDGWSLASTLTEIHAHYRELRAGRAPRPVPPRSRYRDFVAAERAALASPVHREFWHRLLADRPGARLPRRTAGLSPVPLGEHVVGESHERDAAAGHGVLSTPLPAAVSAGLDAVARRCGVPFKSVVLAAHLRAVGLATGNPDVLVGLTANGRLEEPDGEEARGLFLNTVPFRLRLPSGSWADLVRAVFAAERELLPHRRYPMAALRRELGSGSLFDATFTYNHFHQFGALAEEVADSEAAEQDVAGTGRTDFLLGVTVSRDTGSDGLRLELEYDARRLTADQVTVVRDYHLRALRAMAAEPDAPHGEAVLLGAAERELLAAWSGAEAGRADAPVPVPALLRDRALRDPEAVALEDGARRVTYAELEADSARLARRLRRAGVGRGDLVGICLPAGRGAVTAVWAVWRAGAAFVPLDPELPAGRLRVMARDAGPVVLVAEGAGTGVAGPVPEGFPVLRWDGPEGDGGTTAGLREDVPVTGRDLAYVMYTSGTSGAPKGVAVEHGSLAHYATALLLPRLRAVAPDGERLRVALGTSAFLSDFFLEQVLALLDGHTLLVLPGAEGRDPRRLVALAQDAGRAAGVVGATTAQVQLLVEAGLLDAPHPPRLVTLGGEACPPDLWAELSVRPGTVVLNTYGPTEATVDVTAVRVTEHPVPVIGRPLGGVRVRVLDAALREVPPGGTGELFLAGPAVARGYRGRPRLTADVFVPDPWGPPGARMYRTGDLVRFTAGGLLEFAGRVDEQLKISGQRVEPAEIEALLRSHPAVAAAAVTAHRDGAAPGARTTLVAHVVPAGAGTAGAEVDGGALTAFLADRLPAPAVPAVVRTVPALPLTPGGKLDRAALRRAAGTPEAERLRGGPPVTRTQRRVAAVWCEVLGLPEVGIEDDFVALGGHSLLAVRLVMRLGTEFGVRVRLHEVFERPTVAAMARRLDEQAGEAGAAGAEGTAGGRIVRAARTPGEPLPASYAQERLWFLWQLAPDSATYHVTWAREVEGPLDVARLGAAVDALIGRFEALRTTVDTDADGAVVQRIGPPWRCGLAAEECPPGEVAGRLDALVAEPFDLTRGPLLRVRVWRTGPGRHTLAFVAHHVALDAWSLEVFERELWARYRAGGAAEAAGLPEPAADHADYADYARWQREVLAERGGAEREYWTRALAGAVPTVPEPDRPVPERPGSAGDRREARVPAEAVEWLTELRRSTGSTAFMALLAVYVLHVARHAGSRDVTVGTPVSGRSHPDTAPMVGFFVNTLALRVRIDPEADFAAHLARVRAVVLEAFAHQELPFEQVVRAVRPEREAGGNPLFRTMFTHVPAAARADAGAPPELRLTDRLLPPGGAHFDLSLEVTEEAAGGLGLALAFRPELYDGVSAERLLESFAGLLAELGRRPGAPLREVLAADEAERERLAAWQGPVAEVPARPVQVSLAERAARTPGAVAVRDAAGELSFAGFAAAVDGLARRLVRAGVRRGDVVGVRLRPGRSALVAIWAVWRAGAAFVVLDPELPAARQRLMAEEAEPVLVLAGPDGGGPLPEGVPVLEVGAETGPVRDGDAEPVVFPAVGPRDLAAVLYTSGSTGRPKGVLIEHGGLANFAERTLLPRLRAAGGGRALRMAAGTSAFVSDFFLAQILALLDGHPLTLLSAAERRDPRLLVERARRRATAVDTLDMTTAQVQLLVEAGLLEAPYPPRVIVLGGEACPPDLWAALRDDPRVTAFNAYGPSETTVEATYAAFGGRPLPVIGRPDANTVVRVLDAAGDPVPPGTVGEIHIGGAGVGRGYLRDPALTADRYVPDPWGPPGSRLYRSGDLGRYTADGLLEFRGRTDGQVKITGQRVEPAEVEAALRAHPGVSTAVVTAHQHGAGTRPRLVAHVVPAGERLPEPGELRRHLARLLPEAAIPTDVVRIDALPRTASGKLDRAALPAAADGGPADGRTPRTATERRLAGVWAEVLGRPAVGVHEDFFALGGHSLLAVRLAERLRERFGVRVPLARLYGAPTVAAQAAYLDGAGAGSDRVVPLGGTPGAVPLVLAHPLGGTLFGYRELVAELAGEFEVLGLQGDPSSGTAPGELGALAAGYARELAPLLAGRGPVVVAGWSAGGAIAHEVAVRLREAGVPVARLVVIDAEPGRAPGAPAAADGGRPGLTVGRLEELRAAVLREGPGALLADAASGRAGAVLATLGVDAAALAELDGPTTATLLAYWRDLLAALGRWRPARFAGETRLVLSLADDPAERERATAGWQELTGSLTVAYTAGDHFQMLRRPHVGAVADAVRDRTEPRGA